MFNSLRKSDADKLRADINMSLVTKEGWSDVSMMTTWHSIPSYILGCVGTERQILFSCYSSMYDKNLDVTLIEPAPSLMKMGKSYTDFYLGIAIEDLQRFAKSGDFRRILLETYLPSAYDHLLDHNFVVLPRTDKVQGYKKLK